MTAFHFFVNLIAYCGILGLFIYDAISYWTAGGRNHVALKGEMTGLGILGTFTGIYLGLLDFDVGDISGSIPALLDGLKTAFGTSIAGLLCSTGLTIAQAVKPVSFRKTGDPIADTLVRVFQEFEPLMVDLRDANRQNAKEIVAMRKSIESTMDELAKGVTKEIIGALEKVIADFNSNLQEQFGENFKRLNEACFKLVDWQEGHKESVDKSTAALRDAAAAYELLRKQSEAMLVAHKQLLIELRAVGEESGSLAEAAARLHGTTEKMGDSLARADRAIESVKEHVGGLEGSIQGALNSVQAGIGALTRMLEEELKTLRQLAPKFEELVQHAGNAAISAESAAEDAGKTNRIAGETIVLTHDQMEKALRNLEQALTALTMQFSDAYRNYLDGLRKLTDD
jgi:predicted  nucleic acid-binding Zn-ribbon protein